LKTIGNRNGPGEREPDLIHRSCSPDPRRAPTGRFAAGAERLDISIRVIRVIRG